jgi:hypothetical protein
MEDAKDVVVFADMVCSSKRDKKIQIQDLFVRYLSRPHKCHLIGSYCQFLSAVN